MDQSSNSPAGLSASSTDEKEKLLRMLRQKRVDLRRLAAGQLAREQTSDRKEPASCAQARLWFIEKLHGESTANHISIGFRIEGVLNEDGLRRAFDTLVDRHDALRTVIVDEGAHLEQTIHSSGKFKLAFSDLSNLDAPDREAGLRTEKLDESRKRFDLTAGPLSRGLLIRVCPDAHVLIITMHHIISDGWSMGIFCRELSELYRVCLEGRESSLQPRTSHYANYARWQRQWLLSATGNRHLEYWRTNLKGAATQLELPTDYARPERPSSRGRSIDIRLDRQLTSNLNRLSKAHGITLSMALYASWAILLSRLSVQEDVLIGAPIANRPSADFEGVIGFFANTLVFRFNVCGEMRIDAFLKHVKDVALGAYDHQNVPFEKVVEAIQPQRTPARHPVFQVLLAMQVPGADLSLPGLTINSEPMVGESSQFDLVLSLEYRADEVTGSLRYAADLFRDQTAELWVACLVVLIKGIAESPPDLMIRQLPILPRSERSRVIESFNCSHAPRLGRRSVSQLIEDQADRQPDATALIYEGMAKTYSELNGAANQLARLLVRKGVGYERPVGVYLERGAEMVVALLAIMKAGGAYVPIDSALPSERVQYMIDDARPVAILTQPELRHRLPKSALSISLDSCSSEVEEFPRSNFEADHVRGSDARLAYVIYTSGSTGRPKGVLIDNSALVNFLLSMQRQLDISTLDSMLAVTTISFDIAALELFLPLITGGMLVVASRETASNAHALMEMLERYEIKAMQATPATWQMLLDGGWKGRPKLKALCGGESLTAELSRRLVNCVGTLWNLYGPTETAIWSCCHRVSRSGDDVSPEPIGQPIENTRIYILDRQLSPVPVGVTGEIYIGGTGVSRGYVNRSELTAEKFIPDLFGRNPGGRLYATGDLGRWRMDGTIDCLGRHDRQVKIRGFRVELGEIESQLTSHRAISAAVVIVREDHPGERTLVAYFILRERASVTPEELRTHLKHSLPDYMVPSAFVSLKEFPLTPNGKLDRRALPLPDATAYITLQYESPEGPLEVAVASIWRELLKAGRIGRNDNFFDLGGHSLLAMRVISRIRESLCVDIPLRTFLEAQNVRNLSAHIKAAADERAAEEAARVDELTHVFREDINLMDKDRIKARIEELERQLAHGRLANPGSGVADQ